MKFHRHSPSSLNLFVSCPSMFVLEKILGKRQPVGSAAWRGTAVEDGITAGLMDPAKPVEECVAIAEQKFRELAGATMFGGLNEKAAKSLASIPAMVAAGIESLRPYGVPTGTQGFIEWKPEGLQYPIVGYYDYAWDNHGIIVDLKTTDLLPSEIKKSHARQVALYTGGNLEGRVHYQTPKKQATYLVDNIAEHRESLRKLALSCEKYLAQSDDPAFFISITPPDLESYYFAAPAARQTAFEVWGI